MARYCSIQVCFVLLLCVVIVYHLRGDSLDHEFRIVFGVETSHRSVEKVGAISQARILRDEADRGAFRVNTDASTDLQSDSSSESKAPVKVFILLGQSNMLGFGSVGGGEGSLECAVKEKGLYPYLIDGDGTWTVRHDVRNVEVTGSGNESMKVLTNEGMTIRGQTNIGPEFGIGEMLGDALESRVMILKSCIGNRALGWDLLPPGSEGFEYTDDKGITWEFPGYKGSPDRWEKGTVPVKVGWYAGIQYDGDVARAKQVLDNLNTFFPGAEGYEVAGFFWWQGDKDSRSPALANRYEINLVQLIKQVRQDFDAPDAKFVCASLGQSMKGYTDGGGRILDAMFAVDGRTGKYPEFNGTVATVYAHLLSKGGCSGNHYLYNAETYMNVGEAMGKTMVELLMGTE